MEVEEAARKANAHDYISTLQLGYDTHVGDKGAQLSGGTLDMRVWSSAMQTCRFSPFPIFPDPNRSKTTNCHSPHIDYVAQNHFVGRSDKVRNAIIPIEG
jgi:hypothetical protein